MNPIVEAAELGKVFGSQQVVKDISLQVDQGSIYALTGPNGSGKTTAISMLMRTLRPSNGQAYILGKNCKDLKYSDWARIGYLRQESELPGWMTAEQYLSYLKPYYPSWDTQLSSALLRNSRIAMSAKISTLSRGERAMVALLSVLIFRPEVLVLDEPFAGVDREARSTIVEGLLRVASESGTTVFVCTHDLAEIETFISHMGVLVDGELRFSADIQHTEDCFRSIRLTFDRHAELDLELIESLGYINLTVAGRTAFLVDRNYIAADAKEKLDRAFPGSRITDVCRLSIPALYDALSSKYASGDTDDEQK